MKTAVLLIALGFAGASAARAAPRAVEPGAVEAASAVQSYLAAVPQNGGVLDPAALLSTIQERLSAPDAGDAEIQSGMDVLRYMTDSSAAIGMDRHLRTARTADDPALGRRAAKALKTWFAAVHRAKAQLEFIETEQRLSLQLSRIGRLDADQVAAAMDGSLSRAGTVASRVKDRKAAAAASRLTLAVRVRAHPGWDRVEKISGHPAWSSVGAAARISGPMGSGTVGKLIDPLMQIDLPTMNWKIVAAALVASVLLAFNVFLEMRVPIWKRKVSTLVPAMNGYVLGALFLAILGARHFGIGQLLAGGALALAVSLAWDRLNDYRASLATGHAFRSVAVGALAALAALPLFHAAARLHVPAALSAMPLSVFAAVERIVPAALHAALAWLAMPAAPLEMIAAAALAGMIVWITFPSLLAGVARLHFRRGFGRP